MIDSRLSRLDSTLQRFINSKEGKNVQELTSALSPSHNRRYRADGLAAGPLDVSLEDTFYRGDPSFDVRSGETSKFLESAFGNSDVRNGIAMPSNTLQNMLRTDRPCSHSRFEHDLPMPSRDLILRAVRLAKETRQRLLLSFAMIDLDILIEKSQKIYFPIDGYSIADFITVHAALLFITRNANEAELRRLGMIPSYAQETISLCQRNVMTALKQLTLFLQPCMDNIVALVLGAQVALEESKLSMAWTLTSMSARLCLDAGLHRLKDSSDDLQLNYKKSCFWHVYSLDKILALNFGRTANLQDFDITTSYPNSYPWLPNTPWHTLSYCFYDSSKARSRIYEKLYSAHGESQDLGSKTESARSIAAEIERLIAICKSEFSEVPYPDDFHAVVGTFLMTLYSILALTYSSIRPAQASNPLEFSPECISTARTCLQLHCELSTKFMARADDFWRSYIDWGLLFSPFTPFLTLLCAATSNPGDQQETKLLSEVVTSLEVAAERATGARKLYKICQILYQTALRSIDEGRHISTLQTGANLTQFHPKDLHNENPNHLQQFHRTTVLEQDSLNSFSGPNNDPTAFTANANTQSTLSVSDDAKDLSTWFEGYFGGNTSMLDILETDQAQFNWGWANL